MYSRNHSGTRLAALLLPLFMCVSLSAQDLGPVRNARPGQPLPAFSLKSLDGTSVTSQGFKGKALILIFIRPQNSRSIKAMRSLAQIVKELNDPDLEVLAIGAGPHVEQGLREMLKKNALETKVALDPERKAYGAYGVIVTPTTYVVDRSQTVRFVMPALPMRYRAKLRTHARLSLGHISQKEHDQILLEKDLPQVRTSDPTQAKLSLARILIEKKKYARALRILQALGQAGNEARETSVLIGRVYLSQGKLLEASKKLQPLANSDHPSHELLLTLGRLEMQLDNPKKGLEYLTAAEKMAPSDPETLYELGRAHEKRGEPEKALECYRKALSLILGRAPPAPKGTGPDSRTERG